MKDFIAEEGYSILTVTTKLLFLNMTHIEDLYIFFVLASKEIIFTY